MAFLQIVWDEDGSIDRFPLSKKSEKILNEQGVDEFLESIHPKFGNIDNHSTWLVADKLPEIRLHRRKA